MHAGVDRRDQHQGDQGGDGQTADHRAGEGGLDLAAGPAAEGQGEHSQHRGAGGHQDRAQAQAAGLHHRLADAQALLPAHQVDVIHQHNGIIDHDADQHHHPHQTLHVQRGAGEQEGRHHPDEGQGHRHHHDQRIEEALELGGHHHVDQHHRHQDREGEVAPGLLLLLVLAAEHQGKALRQGEIP